VKALQREGERLTAIAKQTGLNWRTIAKLTKLSEFPERRRMIPKARVRASMKGTWHSGGPRAFELGVTCCRRSKSSATPAA
jgi:hypothetical protein